MALVRVAAEPIAPLFDEISLTVINPISERIVNMIATTNLSDCAANVITSDNTVPFGLPEIVGSFNS